ncbi:hypothetical protein YC2023_121365 [Brassica napus]
MLNQDTQLLTKKKRRERRMLRANFLVSRYCNNNVKEKMFKVHENKANMAIPTGTTSTTKAEQRA